MLAKTFALFVKDFQLDFRQRFALGSIILYVIAAIFIIYLAFREVTAEEWVVLYWIVVLFTSVNAVLKAFTQEGDKRNLYYYTIIEPMPMILAKLTYNFLLLLILAFFTTIIFSVFTTFPIVSTAYFGLTVILACLGIATNFSFISTIAAKTRNKSTMMMILSFPVIIPLLLPVVQLSLKTLDQVSWKSIREDFYLLIAIDLLILGISLVIWPLLWRE